MICQPHYLCPPIILIRTSAGDLMTADTVSSLFDHAVACDAEGRLAEAIDAYNQVIDASPDHAPAHNKRGVALARSGQIEAAVASIDKAISLDPDYADAFYSAGVLRFMLGNTNAAIMHFEKAISRDASHAKAHHNLGIALFKTGDTAAAINSYDQALSLTPDFAEAHKNRGLALHHLDQFEAALAAFARALEIAPGFADALNARAQTLTELDRFDEALADLNAGLARQGDDLEMVVNRGVVLTKLGRFDEALADLDLAISREPGNAVAHYNKGVTLAGQLNHEAALASYDQAIEINPDYAQAHNNRGATLNALMRLDDALAAYDRAVEIDPHYAEAWWNKALVLILRGAYLEGWHLYEWRLKTKDKNGHHPLDWRGETDIAGKKIFIPCEQGYGDILQFCRYLPMLAAQGAEIIFEVPETLLPVISTLDCEMKIITPDQQRVPFDAFCPLMSLPYVMKTDEETVPADVGYLAARPARISTWQDRLEPASKPRIGLAWSGNAKHINDHNRSLGLENLAPVLTDEIDWHSLQKEYRPADLDLLDHLKEIIRHEDDLEDFGDTAGLIMHMDLVITVDTSIAHLAGALGKPVWILLPFVPDYRWGLDRSDSLWYPTARLFRQNRIGSWQEVITAVKDSVTAEFAGQS